MDIRKFNPIIAHKDYTADGKYIPTWRQYIHKYAHAYKIDANACDLSDFGPYSPAYTTTNEDWRFVMRELKPANKSVLTVTGSGDQPIAFAINGAKHIDTFDTSFFANIIMQMKISAIQTVGLSQYKDFINNLSDMKSVRDIPMYQEIMKKCDPHLIIAANQMHGCKIFGYGNTVHNEYMPNQSEYDIAKNKINQPMEFIWTDLCKGHTHLNQSYDIIYLSNIFEHFYKSDKITNVINNLKPFVNVNGQITLHTSWVHTQTSENIMAAASKCPWGKIESREQQNAVMLLLTRVR